MSSTQSLPHVALLGRPNVGKSTLFNRLLKRRRAVVSEIAGTTRDRIQEVVTHAGVSFVVVDMAGIEPALQEKNDISIGMQQQVEQALQKADVLVWVVDGLVGLTPQDEQVAELLRRLHKPVVVAVNKTDDPKHELMQFEFSRFGFEPLVPVSAVHAKGIVPLLDAIIARIKDKPTAEVLPTADAIEDRELRLAILGRPNVGKSTLLNSLAGEERAVVSPISGTTRDAIDTILPAEPIFGNTFTRFQTVRVIDTAGIRQRGKMGHGIEAWSVLRSMDSLDDAHVILFVINAAEHMTHQDLTVAERILGAGRPLIIVVNKWDLHLEKKGVIPGTEEAEALQETYQQQILGRAPFLSWTQLIFVSAKTGLNLHYLGRVILRAYQAWSKVVPQDELDELVAEVKKTPRLSTIKRISFEHAQPPVFIVHVQDNKILHFTVRRFLERALREYFDIGPTPIKIWVELAKDKKRQGRS